MFIVMTCRIFVLEFLGVATANQYDAMLYGFTVLFVSLEYDVGILEIYKSRGEFYCSR
jgi:hypothetical protein